MDGQKVRFAYHAASIIALTWSSVSFAQSTPTTVGNPPAEPTAPSGAAAAPAVGAPSTNSTTSAPVAATSAGARSAGAATQAADASAQGDIIVTAQRRSERLQNVPITIAAVTGAGLAQKGIQTTAELREVVPSLNYETYSGFARPYLRGIGNQLTGPNLDPEVATYQDGVYISNTLTSSLSLLGTERVEVLSGPQGTLYGRNATAGAINVITKTPTDKFEADALLGYGNYNAFQGAASVSGPIGGDFSAGIYAAGSTRDHYYKNLIPLDHRSIANKDDGENNWGVRAKVVYDNGSDKVVGTVEYTKALSNDAEARQPLSQNATAFTVLGLPYFSERLVSNNNDRDIFSAHALLASVNGDFDLGFAHLVTISAYRRSHAFVSTDGDGSSASVIGNQGTENDKFYSQEIQLQSNASSKLKWVVGAFGSKEDTGWSPLDVFSSIVFAKAIGPGLGAQVISDSVDTKSWAVFAQATYPITDTLKLTGGARYSKDYKSFEGQTYFVKAVDREFGPPVTPITNYNVPNASWGSFTPKASLDFRPGNTLFYASYSKGFKAGAYNANSPATPGPVNPETLDAYEVGTKGDYLGGTLRLNSAFYYYLMKNVQLSTLTPGGVGATLLQNAASVRAYGADITASIRMSRTFSNDLSVSVERAYFANYPNAAGFVATPTGFAAISIPNLKGAAFPYAPKVVISDAIHHTTEFANGGKLVLNADIYFNGGFHFDIQGLSRQEGYAVAGASATYTFPGEHFTVTAYVRNMFDKAYLNSTTVSTIGVVGFDSDPRTFGMTVGAKF